LPWCVAWRPTSLSMHDGLLDRGIPSSFWNHLLVWIQSMTRRTNPTEDGKILKQP
jgi:hypothetical protein